MSDNPYFSVMACIKDQKFRDMLYYHSGPNDYKLISDELDRIGIYFDKDTDGSKRDRLIQKIISIHWHQMKELDHLLRFAEGTEGEFEILQG